MNKFIRSQAALSWNRDTIMDYLQSIIMTHALIDGLSAQLNCLNQKKNSLGMPSEPVRPRPDSSAKKGAKTGGMLAFLPAMVTACSQENSPTGSFQGWITRIIVYTIAGAFAGWMLGSFKSGMVNSEINREYRKRYATYQAHLSAFQQAQALLDQHILQVTYQLDQAKNKLNTLLNADIVYPSYREPWHIYIIWEHMDRRPDLSYLQAEDLSTEDRRVYQVTSALQAVRQSIDRLYGCIEPIRLAIYQVSDDVNYMNQSLSGQISSLNSSIQSMQNQESSSDYTNVLHEMNRTLSSIQYNQYQALVNEDLRRYGLLH